MALAYLTLGERRFYTSSGTWPSRLELNCGSNGQSLMEHFPGFKASDMSLSFMAAFKAAGQK